MQFLLTDGLEMIIIFILELTWKETVKLVIINAVEASCILEVVSKLNQQLIRIGIRSIVKRRIKHLRDRNYIYMFLSLKTRCQL